MLPPRDTGARVRCLVIERRAYMAGASVSVFSKCFIFLMGLLVRLQGWFGFRTFLGPFFFKVFIPFLFMVFFSFFIPGFPEVAAVAAAVVVSRTDGLWRRWFATLFANAGYECKIDPLLCYDVNCPAITAELLPGTFRG